MNAISPNVFIRDGAVFANSRDVAAYFERNHRDVLRDVDNLLKNMAAQNCAAGNPMFRLLMFTDPTQPGREFRSFDMTRDGFTLLAMGFTGPKALRFKLAYIEAFNAMETALKDSVLPSGKYPDDLPMEEARHWLRMIGEARMLFGKSAARDLWRRSPLPETGVDAAAAGVADDPGAALNGRQCLDHLLSWEPLAGRPPLGALLASGDVAACRRELARFGIDPAPRGMAGYFAVAYTRQCRPLVRRFAGTPWDGLWSAALQHVPGARRSRQSIWVGCTSSKAVMIPYVAIGGAADRKTA